MDPHVCQRGTVFITIDRFQWALDIDFQCFNTAWLSQRHDLQAKLYVPPQVLKSNDSVTDLSVAVFHHPYNWINHNNYRTFKSFIDTHADFALTGHEHVAGGIREANLNGATIDYIQGAAMKDPSSSESWFQIIAIDFETSTQTLRRYQWVRDRFSEISVQPSTLNHNGTRRSIPFLNNSEFITELHAMGTGLHHPRCTPPYCQLKLRDLYVYPTVRHRNLDYKISDNSQPYTNIEGETLAEFIRDKKKVIIYGADDTGKSALARILYDDLRTNDLVPILITSEQLRKRSKKGQIQHAVDEAVLRQYSAATAEPFRQLDRDQRLVIIDDFDKARFTRQNQEAVISYLGEIFGTILIFASDIMQLQDLARNNEQSPLRDFEFCTLREFGTYHRHKLIHRWLYLGREDTHEFESFGKEVLEKDKTISTLLGRNVLPHIPVTILTLLQLLESGEAPNTANGSYGYLYEVLIKYALSRVGKGASDVDAKITYLSGVGFHMFSMRQSYLTEEDFRTAHQRYCERYDMTRDFSQMSAEFQRCEILVERSGLFRFKYPYIYYYAVAKYLHDNVIGMSRELEEIADHTYNEINANVLIFYVYLTKDTQVIKRVIANAKCIFAKCNPCTLEGDDTAYLNTMLKVIPPPLELVCSDQSTNRDDFNRRRDERSKDVSDEESVPDLHIKYDESLEEIIKIQIAFKTLQILGQILRNFTGSLEKEIKLEITQECYSLGLRVLSFVLSYSGSDLEDMRQYFGSLIAEKTGISDTKDLAKLTDSSILWLCGVGAFACIKRISYAVGHADLVKTYSRVLETNNDLSTQIIDATIKLDHFAQIPQRELNGLKVRVHANPFANHVMQEIVAEYLYLYNNDSQIRQSLGSQWNIRVVAPKLISNSSKR